MPGRTSTKTKQSTDSNSNSQSSPIKMEDQQTEQPDSTTGSDNQHPINDPNKEWNAGDRVLCRYMHADNIYYEAKVVSIKHMPSGERGYAIHYPGWSSRHDEVVPQNEALLRFKDYSKEEADKAKEEIKRAQQTATIKKRKMTEKRGTLDDSRSSTPASGETSAAKRKPLRRPISSTDTPERKQNLPQVVLPDSLRRILIDDENLINKSYFLPKLPARVNVYEIVQKYRDTVSSGRASPQILEHSALGLLDYFETAIGTILLYKFERPMFTDLQANLGKDKTGETENDSDTEAGKGDDESKQENRRICYSKQFGLPHLLRMFVRFTDMLSYTDWSERSAEAVIRHAQDFVMFLSDSHKDFFNVDDDYVMAAPDYHKRVWGNNA